jgi:2-methylcitrate dehydratase PrpD
MAILDYVASAAAGYKEGPLSGIARELVCTCGGKEESSILFGSSQRVPSINAAFVNGVFGHGAELDDGHRKAMGHPGVTVVPAALAVAEATKASGQVLITGIVAGYDIFVRIARSMNPSHFAMGFHTTGTVGAFAAAAAAANILGLTESETVNALGLAGLQGAGLLEVTNSGQMAKPMHAGKAAHSGVLSALLARAGAEGPHEVLEGEKGFMRAMADRCDYDGILAKLGEKFEILDCYIKLYPSCRHTHAAIDAVLALRKEPGFDLDLIDEVIVKVYPAAISLTGKIFFPDSPEAAKFSLPYCVAVALVEGKVGLKEFTREKITDPVVLSVIKKTKIEKDASLESAATKSRGAIVELTLKDGRKLTNRVTLPKGEAEVPVTEKELEDKLLDCAAGVLSAERCNLISKEIARIDLARSTKKLMELLQTELPG